MDKFVSTGSFRQGKLGSGSRLRELCIIWALISSRSHKEIRLINRGLILKALIREVDFISQLFQVFQGKVGMQNRSLLLKHVFFSVHFPIRLTLT